MNDSEPDSPAIDHAFVRFRDAGDAEALAAVFDATAPELVRIARHLVHDAHTADDLVQATFLSAIASAQRFDAERRVVPWLVGILGHHVANHRRRAQRSRTTSEAAEPSATSADPAHAAAHRELATACEHALRGLPEPYGAVVRLSVGDGLRPVEVARTLRRSEGTVRSQLHRGLELLRRALPATAVAVTTTAVATGDLAAMRQVVLARAAAAGKAGAAGGTVALWWKLAALFAVVAGLALGAFALDRAEIGRAHV